MNRPGVSPIVSSNRRRERAKATRRRIIDAAYGLFAEVGYPSTTMEAIANEAEVAVQTVYHVFHTKAELLRNVIEISSTGQHDPLPLADLPWMREALTSSDGRRTLALSVEHGIDMSARVAPLSPAINAATSTDPDFASFWNVSCEARRNGTAQIAATLAGKGLLRPALTPQRAADIIYATTSHESLLAFLNDCGWSLEEVKAWYYAMLCEQLLSDDARRGAGSAPKPPTEGLTFDPIVSPTRGTEAQ